MKRIKKFNPIRDKFLIFGSPKISEEEINEVVDTLKSGWIGTGPKVARFEAEFAKYKNVDVNNVAAVNSCTAALHLSMLASDIGPGDEVITTPLTFCATVNAIIHTGATPVLADINMKTMNIDPLEIESKITSKTKAILPVHFAGRPCDMEEVLNIAEKYGLLVIEDCAHSVEAEYKGRKAGCIGDIGCFSFYATKNLVTGEGGMVLSKRPEILEKVKVYALHGMEADAWMRFRNRKYRHINVTACGFKYNMMDLQASLGIHQLKYLENRWQRRKQIWDYYQDSLKGLPITLPQGAETGTRHGLHLFTILIDGNTAGITRNEFIDCMMLQNVGVGVHYMIIPEHPYYQKTFNWLPEHYPVAMKTGRNIVSLPLSPYLTDTDVQDIVTAVKESLN